MLIKEITDSGKVTFSFTHSMLVPLNATSVINDKVLAIKLRTEFLLYEPDLMLLSWKTLNMTSELLIV